MLWRDRDAPVSKEGIIFRVLGYDHPEYACICDVEYAPESLYCSTNPRARREGRFATYYKFNFDEGIKFVQKRFPQYVIHVEALDRKLVGLSLDQIIELRRPDERLKELLFQGPKDRLTEALFDLLDLLTSQSSLRPDDFGVFGSLLHGFHHPDYSDLDLIIYGRDRLKELLKLLKDLYDEGEVLTNEFEERPRDGARLWRFQGYSEEECWRHQRRKLIYGIYKHKGLRRKVKVEFEPVKRYEEVINEYLGISMIKELDWITAIVRVIDDSNAYFMPSVYEVEMLEADRRGVEVERIISFMEEFRGQLQRDEVGLVRGRLERVEKGSSPFFQITLSYGPRYFEQFLKLKEQ